mmetsp:Transcript_16505/g.62498  ORF Transcript_16505/g.62498 Transcript_16505/m.62498 type:complete len:222 (+) Transcript_16505:377-1042(+)
MVSPSDPPPPRPGPSSNSSTSSKESASSSCMEEPAPFDALPAPPGAAAASLGPALAGCRPAPDGRPCDGAADGDACALVCGAGCGERASGGECAAEPLPARWLDPRESPLDDGVTRPLCPPTWPSAPQADAAADVDGRACAAAERAGDRVHAAPGAAPAGLAIRRGLGASAPLRPWLNCDPADAARALPPGARAPCAGFERAAAGGEAPACGSGRRAVPAG